MLADDLAFVAEFGAAMGDAAFLVGDDDLDAVGEDGFFQHALVGGALGGGESLTTVSGLVPAHGADDLVDALDVGAVAEEVQFGCRRVPGGRSWRWCRFPG